MSDFGETTGYEFEVATIENFITLGRFQAPDNGNITSLSWYGYVTTSSKNVKVALYSDGDGISDYTVEKISEGEEKSISIGTFAWHTHSLSASIVAGTWYRLAVWGSSGSGYGYVGGSTTPGGEDFIYQKSLTYGDWPDPFVAQYYGTNRICAYATYTPSSSGYSNKFCGVSIGSICGLSTANIAKISGV